MSTPQTRIAARMRAAREKLGLSQEAVASRIAVPGTTMRNGKAEQKHLTLRTYARWERGESFGYLTRLDDIAKALETTESELLGGEDISTASPTLDTLSLRMDQILDEMRLLREEFQPKRTRRH